MLQTATVSYVKLGTAPWRRDPTLALHAVRWTQLLAGDRQATLSAAAAGGHVVSGVLDAAAIAGLGLSLGGQGHQRSNAAERLTGGSVGRTLGSSLRGASVPGPVPPGGGRLPRNGDRPCLHR